MSNPSISHELHDLTVLDDETTEWLLNTCPGIKCSQAVVSTTRSKEEEKNRKLKYIDSGSVVRIYNIPVKYCKPHHFTTQ